MKAVELYNLIVEFRLRNKGQHPQHGFINTTGYHNVMNDPDVHPFIGFATCADPSCDFVFSGIPFYICDHPQAPLSLVGK